ncbi:MAG: hypothetical protein LDLANPLL_00527 [Turneriella sp.]|nr:hypothetical protein [Turneriella sp.]
MALLIHWPSSYGHWPSPYGAALENPTAQKLIQGFADKIQTLNLPLYISLPENKISRELLAYFPNAKKIDKKSEIQCVRNLFENPEIEHVALFNGIFPLLDISLFRKILALHTEYRADISYGENLPAGISPFFVSRDLLESLEIIEAKDIEWEEYGIRAFVEKNINQFHAEVHYEEPDLRLLRLDFSLTTLRSLKKTVAFFEKVQDKENPYTELLPLIQKSPDVLLTFPSYIELEFSSQSEYKSFFSPLRYIEQEKNLLSRENFLRVKEFIRTGFGDTSVCASGLGEPLEHPDALSYIQELLEEDTVPHVFVETNGVHLSTLLSLASHPNVAKLRVIVFLNSLEKYSDYSGAPVENLEKIKSTISKFSAALNQANKKPQDILYLQVFKVEENEAEIDALYALAEELGATFLFQKYNRYAGLMPERRVSDMTPLERYSCWHLRRDLFIRANGDVAYCKQTVDPKKKTKRASLATESLQNIWNMQKGDFIKNYRGEYPDYLPCLACDEYFTFNF